MAALLSSKFVNLIICNLLLFSFSKGSDTNICTSHVTCGACIGFSQNCHWCKAPDSGTRCDLLENLKENGCGSEHVVSPKSELSPIRNESTKSGTKGQDPIQLSPQEILLNLRPNSSFQFPMVFRQAENYPVDLYFIMDVSNTMAAYKETLGNFSQKLVDEISKITADYRLGFGTFVDKATLPYINSAPDQEIYPCTHCVTPYGFRNQLSLSHNATEFQSKIRELKMSGNLDAPEGGFDAIMQAAACSVEIGWRNNSRKMILFSTDGSFHYAGDGKLGGIVIPNDGHCHLNAEGYYSESLNLDYPSVSQLSNKIFDKKINVIFVVPQGEYSRYNVLSGFILGSAVGKLADDSSNVIDLVRDNYNKIQSEIELKTENTGNDVDISFEVKCPDNITYNQPKCEKLRIGESVTFDITVRAGAGACRDRSLWNRTFQISPVGLTETLIVHLELICECPCELPDQEEKNSMRCNNSGTYECGICTCNPGYHGNKCECGGSTSDDGEYEDITCRRTNTSEVCQGKGICMCGQCICNPITPSDVSKRYTGNFCECNDFSCHYDNGKICGGTDRGDCVCGECRCKSGYDGSNCACSTSTTSCKDSNKGICNEKGKCNCGKCECETKFKGPTCEECPTCVENECEQKLKCVESCLKPDSESCKACKSNTNIEFVDNIDVYREEDWKLCIFHDICSISFVYSNKNNSVMASKPKSCVVTISKNNFVIIAAVVGGMIAFGLICVFIWKIVITYHDRKEYKAFLEDQRKADWPLTVNPLYKEATSNFKNPTYKPGSR